MYLQRYSWLHTTYLTTYGALTTVNTHLTHTSRTSNTSLTSPLHTSPSHGPPPHPPPLTTTPSHLAQLMSTDTIMLWDDCSGTLQNTVETSLFERIIAANMPHRVCYVRVEINGWIGTSEGQHGCCLVSMGDNLQLGDLFKPEYAATSGSNSNSATFSR